MLRARVDRPRCIGAGNCITIAPTAFDWHHGDFGKSAVVDAASVDEEKLREAALACPTQAIVLEEVAELLKLVVSGLSNDEIAERLDVDAGEVARRLTSTYAKIGASSRADATAFAFQSRML